MTLAHELFHASAASRGGQDNLILSGSIYGHSEAVKRSIEAGAVYGIPANSRELDAVRNAKENPYKYIFRRQ